jgi:uncharacterized RDD family membrane protein YckC
MNHPERPDSTTTRGHVKHLHSILAAIICVLMVATRAAAAADNPLVAAASREHLWFVQQVDDQPPSWEVCHHSTAMHGPHYRGQLPLKTAPIAIAAFGDQAWLVFDPAGQSQRDVYSVRIIAISHTEPYFQTVPAGRMELAPALPADGYLAGIVGAPGGPVALLISTPGQSALPRLLQLRGGQWSELPLPTNSQFTVDSKLVTFDTGGLAIITRRVLDQPVVTIDRLQDDDRWEHTELAGGIGRIVHAAAFNEQIVLLASPGDRGPLSVFLARPSLLLPLGQLDLRMGSSQLLSLGDQVRLLFRDTGNRILLRTLSLPTSTSGPQVILMQQPAGSRSIWAMSLVFAAVIGGVPLVFIARPGSRKPLALPADWRPMPLSSRLLALLIDCLPAAVLTMLAMGAKPADFARIPLLTPDFADSWPYLVMVLLTVGHCCASELMFRRSLGLAFLDGTVVTEGALRPSTFQIVKRNLVKFAMLVIPPLAVFALLTPRLQGLHDSISRTVVAHQSQSDAEVRENSGN